MPRNLWGPPEWHWRLMPVALIDQAPPVTDTWYTVLDTVKNVRLRSIAFNQTNDELAAKNLGVQVTIDGVVHTLAVAASNSNTPYYLSLSAVADQFAKSTSLFEAGGYVSLPCKSLKVEIRNTSAAGTTQHLFAYVRYEQLERIKII